MPPGSTDVLLEHLFRRQSGRMVAHFTRLLGPSGLDLAEEAVQEAMLRALQTWPYQGAPPNPEAWLFRVAHNFVIDNLRRNRKNEEHSEEILAQLAQAGETVPGDPTTDHQLRDDEIAMIFACCHPEIPHDAQVALSLKTVGGFNVREIARAFLVDDATIAQRLVRAKRQIRQSNLPLEMPSGPELERRLDSVLTVIYFLFNEGYGAHEGVELTRRELCREALRLGQLIASSSLSQPRVHALVALMAFQGARLPARVDANGELVLLEQQDRALWDQQWIILGFHHFQLSMAGAEESKYHVEAAIASVHAQAADPTSTDWPRILTLYDHLLEIENSPVVALNRAVVVAKVRGAKEALAAIPSLTAGAWLQDYHLFLALRGQLLFELGRTAEAAECFRAAMSCRCSEPERRFLQRKWEGCFS